MPTALDLGFQQTDVAPVLAAQWNGQCSPDPQAIGAEFGKGFAIVMPFLQRHGLQVVGPPRAIYTQYSATSVCFTLAIPIASGEGRDVEEPGIVVGQLTGGRAYRFTHVGPYPELARTYGRITEFMIGRGEMKSEADWANYAPMWEEYESDPDRTPPEQLITHIYLTLPAGS